MPENKKNVLEFYFNPSKDTLFLKLANNSKTRFKLRKINNNFEFLENKIGLEIRLPKTSKKLRPLENKDFNFNIYIGKKNDSIILKTDNYKPNRAGLEFQVIPFCYSKNEQNIDSLRSILYPDESILKNELDSIKTYLKTFPIKKFFRIYDNGNYIDPNWKNEIKWFGRSEN